MLITTWAEIIQNRLPDPFFVLKMDSIGVLFKKISVADISEPLAYFDFRQKDVLLFKQDLTVDERVFFVSTARTTVDEAKHLLYATLLEAINDLPTNPNDEAPLNKGAHPVWYGTFNRTIGLVVQDKNIQRSFPTWSHSTPLDVLCSMIQIFPTSSTVKGFLESFSLPPFFVHTHSLFPFFVDALKAGLLDPQKQQQLKQFVSDSLRTYSEIAFQDISGTTKKVKQFLSSLQVIRDIFHEENFFSESERILKEISAAIPRNYVNNKLRIYYRKPDKTLGAFFCRGTEFRDSKITLNDSIHSFFVGLDLPETIFPAPKTDQEWVNSDLYKTPCGVLLPFHIITRIEDIHGKCLFRNQGG